ncbi:hypothetical protein OUZ56_028816 [Daphnia magna]|uniref:Uncharacterized protein n=1 Tax=Daphnia magna TaxID=35525 RepID=A0ABR0B501_9CRUS|nr:hypothetical protein OUZ56_028816 [Daphnia magna]
MEGPQEKKTPPGRILECRVEEYLHQFRWSGYKFVPSVENWMTAIYSQPSGDIQFNIYHRNVRREKNLKNKGGCTRRRENKRNTAWDERFIIKLVFLFYFIYLLLL